VTKFNLLTIPQRRGAVAASMFGVCGVVTVLVGVLSIAQGLEQVMNASGSPQHAIVMRSGADTEMMSLLLVQDIRIIADAPGIASSPLGPLASGELFVVINLPKKSTGTDANVPLRGVPMTAFQVRDGVTLLAGRCFERGQNEVIVGRGALHEFAGLELGSRLKVGRNEWTVVGVFTANGGLAESEIWTDVTVLQSAYQRGNSYQSVQVKLESPDSFPVFRQTLLSDPRLNVKVVNQAEYYANQSQLLRRLVKGLGTIIAGLMGVGALFGALNTMYAAVAARTREIATLRALGFGGSPIVCSVMIESLLQTLVGGGAGGALAYLAFDGFRAATMNWQSFSQVAFAFAVTPGLLMQGILYAGLIGMLGGLFPALRAARLPVAAALREP
jgi:putative ABC transport system permease protein